MTLTELLGLIPSVYADLESALIPRRGQGDDSGVRSKDPLDRPAPGDTEVMEHRHKLVRGLRWWVDAVRDPGEHTKVGHDVRLMAAWLLANLDVMAPEDQAELGDNLHAWLAGAHGAGDRGTDMTVWEALSVDALPVGAVDQRMRVADAAKVIGCTVRTIQRRVPVEQRTGGMVLLRKALGWCDHCDLLAGQCAHTRER